MIPFAEARNTAARIRGAQLVPLPSRNHILLEHEPAWARFLEEGVQFGWLNVVTSTPSLDIALLRSPAFPYLLLGIAGGMIFLVWKLPIFGPKTES